MLFLDIAVVLYLDSNPDKNIKTIAIVICTGTFCLNFLGVRGFHYIRNDDPIWYYLTSKNYEKIIQKPTYGWSDYILVDNKNVPLVMVNNPKLKDITKVNYGHISSSFYSNKRTTYKIPFLFYKGVNYAVNINNRKINKVRNNTVTVIAKRGNNSLTVSSKPSKAYYVLFAISFVIIIFMSLLICIKV